MDLLERLTADMKTAMKAGEKDRLTVIRMLISDVRTIDMNPAKPTAEQVVASYGKKLKKSSEEYEKLGQAEQVEKLKFEMAVVDEYLPKKLGAAATEKLVEQFLAASTFTAKDVGKAMGAFMKLHGGEADPAVVNATIKAKLV